MRVLFFGKIAQRAGEGREVDAAAFSTVAEVTDFLCEDPDLAELLRSPAVVTVLDDVVVKGAAPIASAKELAYLPPISGG